jgi:glyoxylase-like metal-dependent hydrolase (beta-lactamase superfamily II)
MVSLLLVGYGWHSTVRRQDSTPAPVVPLLRPAALALVPGIHLLGGLTPAAAYVVETSAGLVLVDTGVETDAAFLRWQMATLGLDWKRVQVILLTHIHGDHSGGAEYLRAATGAKVYAGRADAALLAAGGPRDAFASTFNLPEAAVHPTTVDIELKGTETFTVGDVRVQTLATPGHTPGSVCYLMERGGLRVLFSGDVIMKLAGEANSHSRLARPLGTYVTYLPPRYRGDARDFLATLRQLRALPVPDLVLPGHPRMDPTPQSPCLSQEHWEALLEDGIREMEQLVARYERDGAKFLDDSPKVLLPDLYYLGDFKGWAIYGGFAASRFFVVNAPGGPGLHTFLTSRLQKLGVKPTAPAVVLLTACGEDETAGLAELIEQGHAEVVTAAGGLETVKKLCSAGTKVRSAEDLMSAGWFSVKPVTLGGRGLAPVAYQVGWAGKTVLFSGRIPITPARETVAELLTDLRQTRDGVLDYRTSLERLGQLKPDLWLPARPVNGQNANLYDGEWEEILAGNRRLLR